MIRQKNKNTLLLLIILLLGFNIRFGILLFNKPFNFDENVVRKVSSYKIINILNGHYYQFRFHPQLYYCFIHIWQLFNNSEIWMRLPSVIFAVIAIYILFIVIRSVFDNVTAFIGSFLFSCSAFNIIWSTQLRVYSLLLLLSLLYIFIYIHTFSPIGNKKIENKKWVLYTFIGILAFSFDYSFVWTFISIITYTVFVIIHCRKSISKSYKYKLLISNFIIASYITIYALWVGKLTFTSLVTLKSWIPKPSFISLNNLIIEYISSGFGSKLFLTDTIFLSKVYIIILLSASVYFLITNYNKIKKVELITNPKFIFFIIIIIPLTMSFVISQIYQIFISRNLFTVSIGIITISAYLIKKMHNISLVLIGLWLIINITAIIIYLGSPN